MTGYLRDLCGHCSLFITHCPLSLLLPVLVRGINNLSDARYCAGMGADGLIFTLDPSLPGAVTPELVKELAGWVSGVELIGEFGAMPAADINQLIADCHLSRVLLTGASPADADELAAPTLLTTAYEAPYPPPAAPTRWLTGTFDPAALPALLAAAQPAGLILQGGDEIKPGLRDFTELEAIFEALEAE